MSESQSKVSRASIPTAVVSRLSLYLRELQRLVSAEKLTVSSSQLGSLLDCSDAQVRKDLAYFGQFGYPGVGYRCDELITEIRKILGTDRPWPVALIGTGNLGRALIGYKGFGNQGFRIIAAFDIDRTQVGAKIAGVPIYHLDRLPEIAKANMIRLAMLAVPATAAQSVADRLEEAGIEGVVNFAPVTISLPKGLQQVGVDLAIEMEQLSFAVLSQDPVAEKSDSK